MSPSACKDLLPVSARSSLFIFQHAVRNALASSIAFDAARSYSAASRSRAGAAGARFAAR